MISLFLGLGVSNVLLLLIAGGMGVYAVDAGGGLTGVYSYHVAMGVAAGFMSAIAHLAVYTYFMATSKWLLAATDKAGLDEGRFAEPARRHKKRVLPVVMGAVLVTMGAMFAGAAGDPTMAPLLPGWVHMAMGLAAIGGNVVAMVAEYPLLVAQGRLMDEALMVLNEVPDGEAVDA